MKTIDGQYIFEYKGYIGCAHYDCDDNIYNGQILNTTDMIAFCATKESEIEKEFQSAVNDYIEFKKECGRDD